VKWLIGPSLFGVARWTWLCAVVAALTALALCLRAAETADDRSNQQFGAANQHADDLQVTLDRTEDAHAPRTAIRNPGDPARYEQCLRTARTPTNCQRFMPVIAADQR
jgi:hypothetical protein